MMSASATRWWKALVKSNAFRSTVAEKWWRLHISSDCRNPSMSVPSSSIPSEPSTSSIASAILPASAAGAFGLLGMACGGRRWMEMGLARPFEQAVHEAGYNESWIEGAVVPHNPHARIPGRKRVVAGKTVSVRVDLGGRRILQKKKNKRETK